MNIVRKIRSVLGNDPKKTAEIAKNQVDERFRELFQLVNNKKNPNVNDIWHIAKDIEAIKLNIKFFGYELGQKLRDAIPHRTVSGAVVQNLKSKPSTQKDIESDWVSYWSEKLKVPVIYHRKLWELCYVLQALYEHDVLTPGRRTLGFGCGQEPIPSLLASMGIDVTVTDLDPEEARRKGWIATNQHTSSLEDAYKSNLVSRELFDKHVSLKYVDMNAITADVSGYDACWSICALEHLGSIAQGLDFIENSLSALKSGGIAVHTTEFNFMRDDVTIDNWVTVLLQKAHFREITDRLKQQGHWVAELDFDIGNGPMDRFIDLPPFAPDYHESLYSWSNDNNHIKLMVDGFPSTCFGMIIRKG